MCVCVCGGEEGGSVGQWCVEEGVVWVSGVYVIVRGWWPEINGGKPTESEGENTRTRSVTLP